MKEESICEMLDRVGKFKHIKTKPDFITQAFELYKNFYDRAVQLRDLFFYVFSHEELLEDGKYLIFNEGDLNYLFGVSEDKIIYKTVFNNQVIEIDKPISLMEVNYNGLNSTYNLIKSDDFVKKLEERLKK